MMHHIGAWKFAEDQATNSFVLSIISKFLNLRRISWAIFNSGTIAEIKKKHVSLLKFVKKKKI